MSRRRAARGIRPSHHGDRAVRVRGDGHDRRTSTARWSTRSGRSPVHHALTRITWDMVRDAPRFAESRDVARVLAGAVFVAHNAAFDWRFVGASWSGRAGAAARPHAVHGAAGAQAGAGAAQPLARLAQLLLQHPERGAPPRVRRCARHGAILFRAARPARGARGHALGRARDAAARRAPRPKRRGEPARMSHGPDCSMTAPLVQTRQLGDFRIHALDGGCSGSMAAPCSASCPSRSGSAHPGRRAQPHPARHALPAGRDADALVLIDNGAGNKESRSSARSTASTTTPAGRARRGSRTRSPRRASRPTTSTSSSTRTCTSITPAATRARRGGAVSSCPFPRARYVVQRGEFEYAHLRNERIQASYLPHNFDPSWRRAGSTWWRATWRSCRACGAAHAGPHAAPPVRADPVGRRDGLLPGDVIPTSAHLPLPWIMGYDVEPLVTLESKRTLLAQGAGGAVAAGLRARPRGRVGPARSGRRPADLLTDGPGTTDSRAARHCRLPLALACGRPRVLFRPGPAQGPGPAGRGGRTLT
jgi:hypothetical protein